LKAYLKAGRILIENVHPRVECGRYRAKAVVGDAVRVWADIVRDGPDLVAAVIRYKGPSDARWQEAAMTHLGNDRYEGFFRPSEMGVYRYAIEAFTDRFGTWRRDLVKRVDAGQDVDLELIEGADLLASLKGAPAAQRKRIAETVELMRSKRPGGATGFEDPRVLAALDEWLLEAAVRYSPRHDSSSRPPLELWVDRDRARFGAWYEMFPRSTGVGGRHGTFATAAEALERIAGMGFDVVYLPPIHPIGTTARKGRNNTLSAGPGDVGSPWAIGSPQGGHKDVHPDLGTIEDFDAFVAEAAKVGLEVALDFAIQCSPDHPWATEHPGWFHHRPDGTIKYAENPPKKYQDIYPINFDTEDREGLWLALKDVLEHWISHGVKIFRVDNPHTKSFPFWEWVIEEIHGKHPEVVFLAEAFTRPRVMEALAKLGFSQSYTYFTWRNTKAELVEYMTELTQTDVAEYFRPNFFANTPDILHEYLQTGGAPAFKIRLVLAAFLSPSYGIYSGYELYERSAAAEGSEEYLNSEKYEIKQRDWDREDSLAPYIKRVNEIRHKHPALSELTNLRFHPIDKDDMLAFSKTSESGDAILVVVNLNPVRWNEGTISLGLDAFGLDPYTPFEVNDLITGATYTWQGAYNYVRLDPYQEPAHVFRIVA
jgi:starch synthase (maltosyl-transferring)